MLKKGKEKNSRILCRVTAISLTGESQTDLFDIRISIGIGTITGQVEKPGTAKGEAFILSGRSFDDMEQFDYTMSITTSNPLANVGLQVLSDYINSIFSEMTRKQAAIVVGLLEGHTMQKIADDLGKSKSNIHQLSVSGRWPEIHTLLRRYNDLITLL